MSQELIKEIKEKQEEIKDKVSKLRVVKAGDYVLAEDHNSIVEILKDLNTLLDKIIEAIPPPVKVLSPILLSPRSLGQTELLGFIILEGDMVKEETSLQEYMIEGQPESEAPFETIKSTTTAETSKILQINLAKSKVLVSLKDLTIFNVYSKTVWEVIIEYFKYYVTKPIYNTVKSLYDVSFNLIEGLSKEIVSFTTLKSETVAVKYFIEGQPEETASFTTLKSETDAIQYFIEGQSELATVKPETATERLESISADETVKQAVEPYSYIRDIKISCISAYETKMKPKDSIKVLIKGKVETDEKYTTLKPETKTCEVEVTSSKTPLEIKREYKGVYRSGEGTPAKEKEEKTIEIKKVLW